MDNAAVSNNRKPTSIQNVVNQANSLKNEATEAGVVGEAAVDTPIYDRAALLPGHVIKGPAVVEQLDATTLVFPGDTASVDAALNLFIEVAL